MEHRNEVEIDLSELYYYLKKRIWIVVVAVVVGVVLSIAYTKLFVPNQYTAETRVYVMNRTKETGVSYTDFQISNVMLDDYVVLITGRNVTQEVVDKMGLKMTAGQLQGKIRVTAPGDARVIQISVTDTEPQRAADIANCVREVASVQIRTIMAADAVNLVYEADVPKVKSGPNLQKNLGLGAALGLLLSLGSLTVIHLLDDTVRTEDDVERYLGLSVLGVIPMSGEISNFSQTVSGAKKSGSRKPVRKPQAKK